MAAAPAAGMDPQQAAAVAMPPPHAEYGECVDFGYKPDGSYFETFADGTELQYPAEGDTQYDAQQQQQLQGDYEYEGVKYDYQGNPIEMAFQPQAAAPGLPPAGTPRADQGLPPMAPAANASGIVAVVPAGGAKGADDDCNIHGDDAGANDMYIADLMTEIFMSLGFKIWFTYNLYAAFVIVFFLGYSYLYATLYRTFQPPELERGNFGQSWAYLGLFMLMSFFFVSYLTMLIDMMRDLWQTTKRDVTFWGIGMSLHKAPWIVHFCCVTAMIVVPFFWSMVLTASYNRTFGYFVRFFFYASSIVTLMITLIVFLWAYAMSVKRKAAATAERQEEATKIQAYNARQDEIKAAQNEGATTTAGSVAPAAGAGVHTNQHGQDVSRFHWYDSPSVLEEYGLDRPTMTWMVVVFFFGLMPVFVVMVVMVTENTPVQWNMVWIAVGVVFLFVLVFLRELTNSQHHSRAPIGCLLLIFAFAVAVLIAVATAGNPTLFGVFFATAIASQTMLMRKRPYTMQPHEIEERFGPAADGAVQDDPVNSYLCICRRSFFACIGGCIDVVGTFGKKPVAIEKIEKAERKKRFALWTDQRLLLNHWLLLWVALLIMQSYGVSLEQIYTVPMAMATDVPSNGTAWTSAIAARPICAVRFNDKTFPATPFFVRNISVPVTTNGTVMPQGASTTGTSPMFVPAVVYNSTFDPAYNWSAIPDANTTMTLVDLALMVQLSYTFGEHFAADYAVWFQRNMPHLTVVQPVDQKSEEVVGITPQFRYYDFFDPKTLTHFVVVRSTTTGVSWLRNIDSYSESLVLTLSKLFAPLIAMWPEHAFDEFIYGAGFLRRLYAGGMAEDDLQKYVHEVVAQHGADKVVVVGHGFNGAAARVTAIKAGASSVAFNAPGTKHMHSLHAFTPGEPSQQLAVSIPEDFHNFFDVLGGDSTVLKLECSDGDLPAELDVRRAKCSLQLQVARSLVRLCGDRFGRSL
jgi:hypothetical protein